ncbi:hypothetical protein E2562_030054 [Oryza meyeriana var. granulata]|uniref:Uncharacterized protein n=1 Tax=Oryza meyeriana var. granulata TaxID=110450 RepID=A0A6G1FDY3_9ORYZ|nr:hypothetical protein E2562_030054 [Oryza meyeriana var. granulata]
MDIDELILYIVDLLVDGSLKITFEFGYVGDQKAMAIVPELKLTFVFGGCGGRGWWPGAGCGNGAEEQGLVRVHLRGVGGRPQGSSCESNVGVVLISTLSTALRQNRPAGKSNMRGKGDLIPSIDRPARLVSPGTLLAAQFVTEI